MIVLDRLTPADAPCVALACSDPDTQRWLPLPDPYTVEAALDFIRRQDEAWTANVEWIFAVRCVGQVALAGSVGVHAQSCGVVTLGYWTAPTQRRRGLAARAVRLAATFAFGDLLAQRVEIVVDESNTLSRLTARRAGAVEDGCRLMPARAGRQVTAIVHVIPNDALAAASNNPLGRTV